AGLRGAAPLAAVALLALGAPLALAGEDCLWYLDRNGSWHPGFNCEFFAFCCGTCYQRYCCRDLSLLITERQQKHCLAFSPKTIAGIASAVILFVAVVATTICCFLCSCCYLYRRRQQLQSPFEGDPHDRRPCAATVPIPPGPQSWPRTPTAWLHVPTQRSCTPVSTLPGGTPRLQPCSSSPVRATPALLPWSLRSQLRLCRPSEAEPPPGPGGGQGHLLARPQAQLHPETFWEWSPREEEQELSWDSAVTEGRVGRAWDTRTIFIRSGGRAGKPAWPLLSPALLPGRRPGRLGPSCSSAVDGGEGGAGLGRLHQPWAEAPPPAAPRPALGGIKAKVT
uniref:Uncharacterized protein n=1 Tax=Ovis aries TaxID=9940 RepID=A0AC11CAW2_SHEEP